MNGAILNVMPFVAGSYITAVAVLGFLALTSLLRYRRARRLMANVERPDRGSRRLVR